MPSSFVSRANDGIDLTGIESSLQCIDAEILAFDKESLVLRSFVAELQGDQTLAKTEAMIQQAVAAAESNAERINEWNRQVSPQKIKDIQGFTAILPATNKAVQAMARA